MNHAPTKIPSLPAFPRHSHDSKFPGKLALSFSNRPAILDGTAPTPPAPAVSPMEPTPHNSILIVEDEVAHLNLLQTTFEGAGYRVFAAKDGIAAKDLYARHEKEIDVVLCDMALPELGGW